MGTGGFFIAHDDIWLLDGVRTPFADYNGVLGLVSPIDLGIKVARAVLSAQKSLLLTSAALSPEAYPKQVLMLTFCRATLACTPACRLTVPRCSCSEFVERAWRQSARPLTPSL